MKKIAIIFILIAIPMVIFAGDESMFKYNDVLGLLILLDKSGSMSWSTGGGILGSVDLHKRSGGYGTNLSTWYDSLTIPDNGSMDDFNGTPADGVWKIRAYKRWRWWSYATFYTWILKIKSNGTWHTYTRTVNRNWSWGTIYDSVIVSGLGNVEDVQVYVHFYSRYLKDLRVTLIHSTQSSTRMKDAIKVLHDFLDVDNDGIVEDEDANAFPVPVFVGQGYHFKSRAYVYPHYRPFSYSGYRYNEITHGWDPVSGHVFYTDSIGSSFTKIWNHINCTSASGSTPNGPLLYDGWHHFNSYMAAHPGLEDCMFKAIIIITDGETNTPAQSCGGYSKDIVYQAYRAFHYDSIHIFAVGFGTGITEKGANELNWAQRWGNELKFASDSANITGDTLAVRPDLHGCGMAYPANHYLRGYAYIANDAQALTDALQDIVAKITSGMFNFSGVEVTSIQEEFISTAYETRIYVATFTPQEKPIWEGHLKAIPINLLTFPDSLVIDLSNIPDSLVEWDAHNMLTSTNPSHRNIMAVKNNSLVPFNGSFITPSDLDVSTATERDEIIDFVRSGLTPPSQSYLGDIFHSTPIRIYIPNTFFEDDEFYYFRMRMTQQRFPVVIAGANDGMIHCFNDSTGREMWAVIPNDLLPKLKKMRYEHDYYVDLPPIAADVWFPSGSNDYYKNWDEWKTVIAFGERWGGRAYTVLDVTDPSNPDFLFDYADTLIGYTWSVPRILLAHATEDSAERFFMFFGGGYWPDTLWASLDTPGVYQGVGIYAIDIASYSTVDTGLVMIPPDSSDIYYEMMMWPFAAPPNLVNINVKWDNVFDIMYIGDMGGQLWKINLVPGKDNWVARVLFKAHPPTNYRLWQPFFYEPVVAVRIEDKDTLIWIYVGTGDRATIERDSTENRFYAFVDSIPPGRKYLDESKLKRVSRDGPLSPTDLFSKYYGWYVVFTELKSVSGKHLGEKVVGPAMLKGDTVFVNTFTPTETQSTANPCVYTSGISRKYAFNVYSGAFYYSEELGPGVPQTPRFLFDVSGTGVEINNTSTELEIKKIKGIGNRRRIRWWREH